MQIRCPHCLSTYELPSHLSESARKVRCADCRECWVVGQENVLPLFGPEIVTEALSGRRPAASRLLLRPNTRARLAGSLRRARGFAAFAAMGALSVLAMAVVARRSDVVREWPQAAPAFAAMGLPVKLPGLALDGIEGKIAEAAPGQPTALTIEGRISNLRSTVTQVPRLRFSLRDTSRRELLSWTGAAPKPKLAAGETVAFHDDLASPPEGGADLVVSFADAPEAGGAALPASRRP